MGLGSAFQMQTATAGQRSTFLHDRKQDLSPCKLNLFSGACFVLACKKIPNTHNCEETLTTCAIAEWYFYCKINFLGFYRDTGHTVCYSWKGQYVYKVQGDKWRFGSLITTWGQVSWSSVVNHLYWHSKKRCDLNSRVNISHVNISSY